MRLRSCLKMRGLLAIAKLLFLHIMIVIELLKLVPQSDYLLYNLCS